MVPEENAARRLAPLLVVASVIAIVAGGCRRAPRPVHPALFDRQAESLQSVAILTCANETRPVARDSGAAIPLLRLTQVANAGEALRDACSAILRGRFDESGDPLKRRAAEDLPANFLARRRRTEAPLFQAAVRPRPEVAAPPLSPEEVRQWTERTGTSSLLVGTVQRLEAALGSPTGSSEPFDGMYAPAERGIVRTKLHLVLYDAAEAAPILEHTISSYYPFELAGLTTRVDQLNYARACALRALYLDAWKFFRLLIPHYTRLDN